ncbi:MAG: FUN14 domain-containing protein [Candidatus Babeliales bacterium]
MELETKKATQTAQGWFEVIKVKFNEFANQFDLTWAKLTEFGVAFGLGVLFGFLFKRFGRQVILLFIIAAVILIGLDYFNVITIEWQSLRNIFGTAPTTNLENIIQDYVNWAKKHIVGVIIGLIGFIIGYKIG